MGTKWTNSFHPNLSIFKLKDSSTDFFLKKKKSLYFFLNPIVFLPSCTIQSKNVNLFSHG